MAFLLRFRVPPLARVVRAFWALWRVQDVNPAAMRLAALGLLARRDHLRTELEVKLRRRFGDDDHLHEVLDRLEEEQLLSDQRYTESYVRQRSAKGYGPERIRQELRQRGATADMAALAVRDSGVDWRDLARTVRLRKFGPAVPANFKEKSRQLRFLQYRGFSGEFIAQAFSPSPPPVSDRETPP